jgi:hypothetical protein
LLWLFGVFCASIWILELIFVFLWKMTFEIVLNLYIAFTSIAMFTIALLLFNPCSFYFVSFMPYTFSEYFFCVNF